MRKISLLAVAAALVLAGVGTWATSTPHDATVGASVDPSQMMINPKELPTVEFVDYTFVFH